MRLFARSMIVAFSFSLLGASATWAQSPETIEKVARLLTLKRLQGIWVPDLLLTTEGAEKYPLTGRTLFFDGDENAPAEGKGVLVSGSFARGEGARTVVSGSFKVEDGYLRLTITDRSPWDLETPYSKDKVQYAFKVDQDVLTLCYSVGNKGKADDLTPGKGKMVVVYRRQPGACPAKLKEVKLP